MNLFRSVENKSDAGTNYYRERQDGVFSREGLGNMAEAWTSAAKIGPWFYAIPGGVKVAIDTKAALRAQDFATAHKDLADKVAESKTKELSPERMQSYLQTTGLDGDVLIPADAVWQLQKSGMDIAAPLGWQLNDMEEAASLGHDIVMPVARLQSYLPPEQMKAVADIMREAPKAMSALDAASLNENLPVDLDGLIEMAEEDAFERSAIEGEVERIRAELIDSVKSSTHLMAQITSSTDPETSVRHMVDNALSLVVRRAEVLSRAGVPVSETLSRLEFQGMVKGENGRMVTQEEAEMLAQSQAQEDALAPFGDQVWGRLDADSLRTDFPSARRDLVRQHGRRIFAKNGGGLAVDQLADELKNRNMLPPDADSSTLVEILGQMQRPKDRKLKRIFRNVASLHQENVSNSLEKLDEEIQSWHSKVDAIASSKKPPSDSPLMLTQTPLIMHMLGANFRNLYAAPHVFDSIVSKPTKKAGHNIHKNITAKILKQIPAALADPIMVFDSESGNGRLVFMLEVTDAKGATVIVPVELEGKSIQNKKINILTSVFAKESAGVPNNTWFANQAQKNIRYINTEKTKRWSRTARVQFPFVRLSNASSNNILTEADLDKLKRQYPGYYQTDAFQTEADTKLAQDMEAWGKAVDALLKKPSEPQLMLKQTPLVMNLVGADFHELYATPHVFDGMFPGQKSNKKHNIHANITADILKQVPNALADPIAVFRDPDNESKFIFMLDIVDGSKASVIVPISFEAKKGWAEINLALTVFAKEKDGTPHPQWFMDNAQDIVYINKKKDREFCKKNQRWFTSSGSNSLWVATSANKNNLFTESDLVKLKRQYPGYYHGKNARLGATTPDMQGRYTIQLFEKANLSTLSHEIAHVFFLEMERMEMDGLADSAMLADLATLREWTAGMDDDSVLKAEYERYQKKAVYGGADFGDLYEYQKEDVRSRAKQEMLARR